MSKQNPAYEWLFLIFFLTACCGCGTINCDLKDAIEYQVGKAIIKEGKRQLKKKRKQGLSEKEYNERYEKLKFNGPKGNLVENEFFVVTKKGKLRLAKKEQEALNEDLNRIIGFKKGSVHLGIRAFGSALFRHQTISWRTRPVPAATSGGASSSRPCRHPRADGSGRWGDAHCGLGAEQHRTSWAGPLQGNCGG